MKRFVKMLAATCFAALALAAVSAASAQAARFTASAAGTLTGTQTSNYVFTISAGSNEFLTCKKVHTEGTIIATEAVEQEVTVEYEDCTADTSFGTIPATILNGATYNLTANGEIHILNTITIHLGGLANCNIVVGPQGPLSKVTYDNVGGKIEVTNAVTGVVSTSTGLCPHGTTGTFTGSFLLERVGGGTLAWDSV